MPAEAVLKEKQAQVAQLADRIQRAKSVVLADYRGLSVAEITQLRKALREVGAEFHVVKNGIISRAFDTLQITSFTDALTGPTALAFAEDETSAARVLMEQAEQGKSIVLKGGWVDGQAYDRAQMEQIAKIPPREQLLAMLVTLLQAPIRNFAYLLSQIAEKGTAQPPAEVSS